mgnify:CR=1 FL=1
MTILPRPRALREIFRAYPNGRTLSRCGRLGAALLFLILARPAFALNLAWDLPVDTTNIVGYNIFQATYSLLNHTTAQAVTDPSVTQVSVLGAMTTYYPLTSLGVGTTFYFRSAAYDAFGTMSALDEETVNVSTAVTLRFIILTPASGTLPPGATQQYLAVALDQNGSTIPAVNFAFSTAYSSVATINASGLATAVAPGSTPIYASSNAVTGSVTSNAALLTVYTPVFTSITLTPAFASILPGAVRQFTAVAKDQNGNAMSGIGFTYNTAYSSVAIINATGLSTGVAAGLTLITAQNGAVTSNSASLSVLTAAPPAVAIAVPANGAVVSGIITISGTASSGLGLSSVEFRLDGGAFILASGTATWSSSLNLTNVANGVHTITARATDLGGNQASVAVGVTVANPVLSAIVLTPLSVGVHVGQAHQFTAVAKDQNGATMGSVVFSYSSLYSTVAVINASGLAVGVAPGADILSASSSAVTGLVTSNAAALTVSVNIIDSVNDIQISNNPLRPALGIRSTTFSNLPPNARLRIYTLSGRLVKDITADVAGIATWDATSSSGEAVASGIYFIHAQANATTRTFKIAVQR